MSVKKYCYCENNCKYETLDKEEIYAAITQAIETGTVGDCDTGFVTTIKTVNGHALKFFVGEQSEYDKLTDKEKLFAIITNDINADTLLNAVRAVQAEQTALETRFNAFSEGVLNGGVVAKKATNADNATQLKNEWIYGGEFSVTTNDYAGTQLPRLNDDGLFVIKMLLTHSGLVDTGLKYNDYVTFLMSTMSSAGSVLGAFDNTAYSTLAPYPKNNKYMMFIKNFGAYGFHLMMIDTETGANVDEELTVNIYYKKIC